MLAKYRVRLFLMGLSAIALAATVASAGLTHRYSFNEATPKDSVGKIDAALKGEAKIAGGKLVLENTDKNSDDPKVSHLEFSSSVIPKSGSVSLAVWVSAKEAALFCRVIDFGETVGSEGNAFIYLVPRHEEMDSRAAITAGDTGSKTYIAGPRLDDDKPHLAILVIDGTAKELRYYVDGKQAGKTESLGENTLDKVNPVHCWLGRSSFNADPGFSGSIDEFRVYDHALTVEEIAAIQKAGPDALPPAK